MVGDRDQRKSTHWTSGALGGFWMSIGQNLSPMTRYALVLGSRSCPTLSAAAVCPSLDTCTAPTRTPHKIITLLYKPALWVLLMIGDGGLAVQWGQSWLRTVEADLRPMNLGLATSKRHAEVRSTWRKLIASATSTTSSCRRRR